MKEEREEKAKEDARTKYEVRFVEQLNENSSIEELNLAIGICLNQTTTIHGISTGGLFFGDYCFLKVVEVLSKKELNAALEICDYKADKDAFYYVDNRDKCYSFIADAATGKDKLTTREDITSAIEFCKRLPIKTECLNKILNIIGAEFTETNDVFEELLDACDYEATSDYLTGEDCVFDLSMSAAQLGFKDKAKQGCSYLSFYISIGASWGSTSFYFSSDKTFRAKCFERIGIQDVLTFADIKNECGDIQDRFSDCRDFGVKILVNNNNLQEAFKVCENIDPNYMARLICFNRIAQFISELSAPDSELIKKACNQITAKEIRFYCFSNYCTDCRHSQLSLSSPYANYCKGSDGDFECNISNNDVITAELTLWHDMHVDSFDLHNVKPIISCIDARGIDTSDSKLLPYFGKILDVFTYFTDVSWKSDEGVVYEPVPTGGDTGTDPSPLYKGKSLILFPKDKAVLLRFDLSPKDLAEFFGAQNMCGIKKGDTAKLFCETGVLSDEGTAAQKNFALNLNVDKFKSILGCS